MAPRVLAALTMPSAITVGTCRTGDSTGRAAAAVAGAPHPAANLWIQVILTCHAG